MVNIITIELCAEDRARLDKLTTFLEERIAQVDKLYGQELPAANKTTEEKQTKTEKAEEIPTPKVEAVKTASNAPTEETKPVTVEDIRSKVLELTGAGKRDEVRAIVKSFADKVTEIPADKLAEVLDKLNALEG